MTNWFHRLFNPHCPHCYEEQLERSHCNTCQVLQLELASVKQERDKLLQRILNPPTESTMSKDDIDELKPILPKAIPWNVRRQMLEAEDREKARLMQNAPKPIDELEKEVLG